jgi:hypothetical protein
MSITMNRGRGEKETKAHLPLSGEVSISSRDTKEEVIVFGERLGRGDGVV